MTSRAFTEAVAVSALMPPASAAGTVKYAVGAAAARSHLDG